MMTDLSIHGLQDVILADVIRAQLLHPKRDLSSPSFAPLLTKQVAVIADNSSSEETSDDDDSTTFELTPTQRVMQTLMTALVSELQRDISTSAATAAASVTPSSLFDTFESLTTTTAIFSPPVLSSILRVAALAAILFAEQKGDKDEKWGVDGLVARVRGVLNAVAVKRMRVLTDNVVLAALRAHLPPLVIADIYQPSDDEDEKMEPQQQGRGGWIHQHMTIWMQLR